MVINSGKGDLKTQLFSARVAAALLLGILISASGVACGRPTAETVAPKQSGPTPTSEVYVEYARLGLSDLVHNAESAVIGTIKSIGDPRWNSDSGEPFDGNLTEPPMEPLMYRTVTLDVDRVLWSSDDHPIRADDEVEIFTYGNGTLTGPVVIEDGQRAIIRSNNISGPLEIGRRNLLLLQRKPVPFADRGSSVLQPVLKIGNDFQGNWTIKEGKAVSALSHRTVDLEQLVNRLLAERQSPRRRGDDRGRNNPVE